VRLNSSTIAIPTCVFRKRIAELDDQLEEMRTRLQHHHQDKLRLDSELQSARSVLSQAKRAEQAAADNIRALTTVDDSSTASARFCAQLQRYVPQAFFVTNNIS